MFKTGLARATEGGLNLYRYLRLTERSAMGPPRFGTFGPFIPRASRAAESLAILSAGLKLDLPCGLPFGLLCRIRGLYCLGHLL
jgi:hypothetical protein